MGNIHETRISACGSDLAFAVRKIIIGSSSAIYLIVLISNVHLVPIVTVRSFIFSFRPPHMLLALENRQDKQINIGSFL